MEPHERKFTKPFIKSRDVQERMAKELRDNPLIGNIELAERLDDFIQDLPRDKRIEFNSYALAHLRGTVESKLKPPVAKNRQSRDERAKTKAIAQKAARELIAASRVQWLLGLTYEQLDDTLKIGSALRARMQPGQRVTDVWTGEEIKALLLA